MQTMMKNVLCTGAIAVLCLGAGAAVGAPLNPDFETGDFTDWGFVTGAGTIVADNGPSAAGVSAASITTSGVGGYEQAVAMATAITPGDLLNLSFDYKTLPGATGNWHVQLRYWDGVGANGFSDGGGGTHRFEHTATLDPTDGDWLTTTLTNLPYNDGSNTANYVDIRFIANAFGTFDGTALVDNFSITGTSLAGDGNDDGVVDGLDYLIWAGHFGDFVLAPPPEASGDYNGDLFVDGLDYLVWAGNFGAGSSAAVPEPSSCALWLLASVCLMAVRRARRR